MREQIAEIVGLYGQAIRNGVVHHSTHEAVADRIMALFGEPVAWGVRDMGWPALFDNYDDAEEEAVQQGGNAHVVPLYALGDPE